MDPLQVLPNLSFGRVDAETDDRFDHCFIGTELLRQVLLPQHSLLIGPKGSGKSAIFRLLCQDFEKIRPLLPRHYDEIYCIPAYGMQSEDYLGGSDLRELNPQTVDDFRYFWLLYFGLKAASKLVQDEKMQSAIANSKNDRLRTTYATLNRVVRDIGMGGDFGTPATFRERIEEWVKPSNHHEGQPPSDVGKAISGTFRQRTGFSVITLLDFIDTILQDTNSLAWILLDKLDLLFIGDIEKLKTAINGLVQLLVEYNSRFKNIHWKIFLRTDIYRQLHIVNKSHLISYTTEMRWRGPLLLKLLVSRAVSNPVIRTYCEETLGEKVDVSSVIIGDDAFVGKVFYTIFEPSMTAGKTNGSAKYDTHEWILRHLVDGSGTSFPRELIHLGNTAVAKQREMNRIAGRHLSDRLISPRALKEAFGSVSDYRCDTYLYSEFPHLARHFDVFRGSDTATYHREELYMLFEPLTPHGDEAIRAVYDAGVLLPLGRNVDASSKFKIPLLYKAGLGIAGRHRSPLQKPSVAAKVCNSGGIPSLN